MSPVFIMLKVTASKKFYGKYIQTYDWEKREKKKGRVNKGERKERKKEAKKEGEEEGEYKGKRQT